MWYLAKSSYTLLHHSCSCSFFFPSVSLWFSFTLVYPLKLWEWKHDCFLFLCWYQSRRSCCLWDFQNDFTSDPQHSRSCRTLWPHSHPLSLFLAAFLFRFQELESQQEVQEESNSRLLHCKYLKFKWTAVFIETPVFIPFPLFLSDYLIACSRFSSLSGPSVISCCWLIPIISCSVVVVFSSDWGMY